MFNPFLTVNREVYIAHVPVNIVLVLSKVCKYCINDILLKTKILCCRQYTYGTNRTYICDFLLVINTNLRPISNCFQVNADHW